MMRHAGLATVLATATLVYTALVSEPDLARFDASELKGLLESPRPALEVDLALPDHRRQFADLIVRYAKAENARMTAAAVFISPAIARQKAQRDESPIDPALQVLVDYFNVPALESLDALERTLVARVAPLPPELVAAQAAIESAWGKSRFATEGFNLFGHQCYSSGCGIKPQGRTAASQIEVRRFDSIGDSVAAYYQNLNSHNAYRRLRQIRYELLSQNQSLEAHALLPGLSAYSEEGDAYLRSLRQLLRSEYVAAATGGNTP